MDALGINWVLLLSQLVFCLVILICIVFVSIFIRAKTLSKFLVGFIGFVTALITLLSVIFVLGWIFMFVFSLINPSIGFRTIFTVYSSSPVKILGAATIIMTISLMAYYIPHAAKSPFLPDKDRVYYQIALLFLPFIMMPMYYLKYIKSGGR